MKKQSIKKIAGVLLTSIPFIGVGSFIYLRSGVEAVFFVGGLVLIVGILSFIGGLGIMLFQNKVSNEVSFQLNDKNYSVRVDKASEAKQLVDDLFHKGISAKLKN